tara:strand:+ start:997 stop:3288 length:2292 start_codon:yes stop_codon:yes gene_type:complete
MAKKIRLVFEVQGAKDAEDKTKKVDSSLTGLAKKAGLVTVAFMGAGKLVDAFKSATRIGAEFEQNIKNLSVIAGATGGKLKQLEQSALKLGGSTKFTASSVAQLQIEYSKLGFTADEILEVTEGTLNLSTAFGLDLGQSASVAGATLRAFGLEASETTRMTDVMALSFSRTALDMEKFSNSMSFVAPVASVAGFSLEDTTAILGTLANAGISGSMAGTALRTMMLDLTNSSSKLSKELGTGISSVEELEEALQALKDSGKSTEDMLKLVDKRAVSAFSILLEGTGTIGDLATEFENATGTGQIMATEMLDTLESKFKIMQSASEDLGIAFFDTFDTALKSATDVMTDAIGGLAEMFKLMDESPLETAIRHIDELGGNTLDLRTELAELNLEQAKMGAENLPTINEAIEKQKSNTKELIEQEKLLREAEEKVIEANRGRFDSQEKVNFTMMGFNREAGKSILNAQEERDAIQEKIDSLKQDNEAQTEAIKKRRELEQAELDLKGVRAEADEANKVRVDETDPKDIENKTKLFEIATAEIQILGLKLEMLEAGESARVAEQEAIEFQLENADRLNISEAKRLQLKIQLLKLGQQQAKEDKKKAQDDEKRRKDEIDQLIANSNNAEEALEKKVRAEASNALASLVRSVFESQPFPLNIALAGATAVAGTKAIDWAIGQAKGIKLRQGGFIEGFGGGDRVPAMLERGEFVLNKEAVQNIGINNLSELNAGKNGGGMNIVFNAPVTNEDFVKDFIVPTIKESQERNLS